MKTKLIMTVVSTVSKIGFSPPFFAIVTYFGASSGQFTSIKNFLSKCSEHQNYASTMFLKNDFGSLKVIKNKASGCCVISVADLRLLTQSEVQKQRTFL